MTHSRWERRGREVIWVLINLRRLHYQYRVYFYLSLKEVFKSWWWRNGPVTKVLAMGAWGPEFRALEPKRKAGYWWHVPVIPALGWEWWRSPVVPALKTADTEGVWKLTVQSAYSIGELRVHWEAVAQNIREKAIEEDTQHYPLASTRVYTDSNTRIHMQTRIHKKF